MILTQNDVERNCICLFRDATVGEHQGYSDRHSPAERRTLYNKDGGQGGETASLIDVSLL